MTKEKSITGGEVEALYAEIANVIKMPDGILPNQDEVIGMGVGIKFTLDHLASTGRISGWMPIENAPRDGTRVLGLGHDLVIYTIKYANKFAPQYGLKEGAHGWYCYNTDNPIVGITHWMPLPQPPEVKE